MNRAVLLIITNTALVILLCHFFFSPFADIMTYKNLEFPIHELYYKYIYLIIAYIFFLDFMLPPFTACWSFRDSFEKKQKKGCEV